MRAIVEEGGMQQSLIAGIVYVIPVEPVVNIPTMSAFLVI